MLYCVVAYKWYEVRCKAVLARGYHRVDADGVEALDCFFNVRGIWDYYAGE